MGTFPVPREISFRANFYPSQSFVERFAGILGLGNALAATDGGEFFRKFPGYSEAYGFHDVEKEIGPDAKVFRALLPAANVPPSIFNR